MEDHYWVMPVRPMGGTLHHVTNYSPKQAGRLSMTAGKQPMHRAKMAGLCGLPNRERTMTRKRYDLVVIGAGMAGNAAANKAASLGAQVAIIEKDKMGGT